jgi:hypothetical protein
MKQNPAAKEFTPIATGIWSLKFNWDLPAMSAAESGFEHWDFCSSLGYRPHSA